jgi:hypothetical protein
MSWTRFGGFSGEPGDDAAMQRLMRRHQAPDNEVPSGAPFTAVLARSSEAAVGLTGLLAYSTGWAATVCVRLRTMPDPSKMHRLSRAIGGGPFAADEAVLLGIEYSDGQSAANVQTGPRSQDAAEDALLIRAGGGGGGGRSYDVRFWVTPLPPPGPVRIICAWPAMGIDETRTEFDAGLLLTAAQSATTLWEWEPYRQPEPSSPELPSTGWFAQWAGPGDPTP